MPKLIRPSLKTLTHCQFCPELRSYCADVASRKKREFFDWNYWGKPVPAFGKPDARLWILGLAPAAHGANRTGRMFTGDSSGNWLYRKLHKYGFCSQSTSTSSNDGLSLIDTYISAVIRCAPPKNRPTQEQILSCQPYLNWEFQYLKQKRLILTTGGISFDALKKLFDRFGVARPKQFKFSHGAFYELENFSVLATYHPSRQNTNTGRLTDEMWDSIFERARIFLDGLENHSAGKRNLVAPVGANIL